MKWVDVFNGSERRQAPRHARPQIVVYYWDGSSPKKHQLRDVSALGAFIETEERWYIGTLVRLTLVIDRAAAPDPLELPDNDSISVFAKAVQHCQDGVGVEFVAPQVRERAQLKEFLTRVLALAPRAHTARA